LGKFLVKYLEANTLFDYLKKIGFITMELKNLEISHFRKKLFLFVFVSTSSSPATVEDIEVLR